MSNSDQTKELEAEAGRASLARRIAAERLEQAQAAFQQADQAELAIHRRLHEAMAALEAAKDS